MNMRQDARRIIDAAIHAAQPDTAVKKALGSLPAYTGRLTLIAIGKAAWQMAYAAYSELGSQISGGIVITKYEHSMGDIGPLTIREAGHPVPDSNSYAATQEAIDMVTGLKENDLVLFLISGGGSALFEKPLVDTAEMESITGQLLACGASITEINTIRKHLSAVKGGKFAQLCAPAQVYSVVLSDILGDPLDMIASGPAYPDSTTVEETLAIADKYALKMSDHARQFLQIDTPKTLPNAQSIITGSVRQLCVAAEKEASAMGYTPIVLSDCLCCEAREAGSMLGSIARYYRNLGGKYAIIAGGETVVHLTGHGKGGRNQEMALACAAQIAGLENVLMFSVGSDGTDGPTDAAGGIVTGSTCGELLRQGIAIDAVLKDNDAYNALNKADGLIFTGPTGTNVNDLSCLLIG
ncbi:MAG: glycerate kinase [Clostridia bacterium]|nr:glycerate kinase [Clostridia bacterium]